MRTIIDFFGVAAVLLLLSGFLLLGLFRVHDRNEERCRPAESEAEVAPVGESILTRPQPRVLTKPAPPSATESAEFGALFDRLGTALAGGDAPGCAAIFDVDRFVKELEPLGVLENIPGGNTRANRTSFANGMRAQVGKSLLQNTIFRWERTEVRWVRRSADGREAVVIAYHRAAIVENRAHKMRWSLVKGPNGWKVYDFEDLDLGVRLSRGVAAALAPDFIRELSQNPERFKHAVEQVREALIAIVLHEDADEADDKLKPVRMVPLPAPIAAMREMIEGCILMHRGAPEAALKRFDEADRLQPDIPVLNALRAAVAAAAGRYAEALPLVDRYLAEVGPDADAMAVRGLALEGLNRLPEAKESYRKALNELPDLQEALEGLCRVLEDGEKSELASRIAKASDPLKMYDVLYWPAQRDNDIATLDVLTGWLRKAHPNDARTIRLELHDLIDAGDLNGAAAALRKRLGGDLSDELKRTALDTYLFAMLDAERPLEAYSTVPDDHAAAAFRLLIEEIADRESIELPLNSADPTVKLLRDLHARHRARKADDPWLAYSEGSLLRHEQKFAAAERAFAAGQVRLPKRPKAEKPDPDNAERDWDFNRFRAARVECLHALGQGMRAYAEIGPVADTFGQLALAYDLARDATALEALIAAHRKNEPTDHQLLYWSAELLNLRGKPIEAADAFRSFLIGSGKKEPNRWMATDKCVRGFLRAGQPGKARSAVVDIGIEDVPPALRVAVHLANGRPALAEEILAEQASKGGGFEYFYYDEDFAKQMQRPEYANLRKKYPDTRSVQPDGPPG
jgi:hypothetical protein